MKGLITKGVAALCLAGSLAVLSGCTCGPTGQERYARFVDPCWPERYNHAARASVNQAFAAQVGNGHVLDQTIWNHHFVKGTDKLTPGGRDRLNHISRRRPAPDPNVYLQTANDVKYDAKNAEKYAKDRADLNSKRQQAIMRYMEAQTAERPIPVQVTVHDPSEVGISTPAALQALTELNATAKGKLQVGGLLGSLGGSGGGGGGGGR